MRYVPKIFPLPFSWYLTNTHAHIHWRFNMNCQCLDIGTRRIYTCVDNETQIDSMRQNCVCVLVKWMASDPLLRNTPDITNIYWKCGNSPFTLSHIHVLREMLKGENGHECDNRMVMPLFVKRKIVSIIKGVYVLSNLYWCGWFNKIFGF